MYLLYCKHKAFDCSKTGVMFSSTARFMAVRLHFMGTVLFCMDNSHVMDQSTVQKI
jgi:hypothetical protein